MGGLARALLKMGGLARAPHAPQRSERPGEAVPLLCCALAWGGLSTRLDASQSV